jgi:hypothetical protein
MKFYVFTIILVGIMFSLAMLGYQLPVTGGLVNTLGLVNQTSTSSSPDFSGFTNNSIWNGLVYVLGGLAVAGIVISFFGRTPDINMLLASLVSLLAVAITSDYLWIINKLMSFQIVWISWSMGALFTALMVGFYIIIIDFWRGSS